MLETIAQGLLALGDRILQWNVAILLSIPVAAIIIAFNRETFEEMIGVNQKK